MPSVPDTLPDLFPMAVPHDTAITDGTARLSSSEYGDAIARLAGRLVRSGVARGDRVAVHMKKSVWSFVSVHAALRAGGVMVPLDPLAPPALVRSVIDDAGPAALITDARARDLPELIEGIDTVITDPESLRGHEPIDAVEVAPDDDAYIIYTSGTTGRPKGIVHTHRSALAYARLAVDTYGLRPADRLANVASLHFDQSTFELYAAPLAGAGVVVVPDPVLRFPASTAELIERLRPTVWYSVPYVLRQIAARGAAEMRDLGSLRWILYGGESFPPAELRALMSIVPSARVSNVYGPAEVNQCAYFHLDDPPNDGEEIPIGEAWDGTELVLVDDEGEAAPPGEVGELLVASATMMDRYWDRPDLTAVAIVERGFPERGATRWYRTGDLVRSSTRGLVFVGRVDHQVKIRGHRLEIEPIEQAIRAIADVADAAVVVDAVDETKQLVAVVEGDVAANTIRTTVAATFPRAAIPSEVVVVAAGQLPRTSTSKVDRNAVLGMLSARRAIAEPKVTPP